ncbi:MAG TPA: sn-glycerol-3-phosphate ABC transporter ATP-binding protein UgpC [Gemmatimonadota bacterium]|nr:sn-glycerol-3-phosphate ABC transporter ATP-binding protein UgpC [Gemmatimonadota bacterium]
MASVTLENVRKVYGGDAGFVAVQDTSLEVADGELLVLVGPSGCGKSTILRMIAGLESITAGRLYIDDRLVNDVPPKDRDIAMVFQNYALYPHMSVYENLAFGLKLRKLPAGEIEERVGKAAGILGIEEMLDRRPRQLSGGQRQRVAVGRAIVREPRVFLFDEPLSNLDAKLRTQMRTEIARLHNRLEATMIYVTHDQVEAMTMGDRIVVLEAGRVQQIDVPLGLYERPANRFVAGFIGSPTMNFIEGRIVRDGSPSFRARGGALTLALPAGLAAPDPEGSGRDVVLGIRPEDLFLAGRPDEGAETVSRGDGPRARFVLELLEPMGNEVFVHARAGELPVVARVPPQDLPERGAGIELRFDLSKAHFFDPATGERLDG